MSKPVRDLTALPTLVTLGNAFCGFLAATYVVAAMSEGPGTAGYYNCLTNAVTAMFIGMVFDFLDGKVARLTKTESLFGVQIDSLSDVLSFGLVPALLFKTLAETEFAMPAKTALVLGTFFLFGAVLRLARFNVETDFDDDHRSFKGLPTPAAAAGIASLVFLYAQRSLSHDGYILADETVKGAIEVALPWAVVLLGVLMWTKLPYIHLPNILLTEQRHPSHILLVLGTIGTVAWKPAFSIAVLMLAYALSGPVLFAWHAAAGRKTVEGESVL